MLRKPIFVNLASYTFWVLVCGTVLAHLFLVKNINYKNWKIDFFVTRGHPCTSHTKVRKKLTIVIFVY